MYNGIFLSHFSIDRLFQDYEWTGLFYFHTNSGELGTSGGIIVIKLDEQTFICKFESHWVLYFCVKYTEGTRPWSFGGGEGSGHSFLYILRRPS